MSSNEYWNQISQFVFHSKQYLFLSLNYNLEMKSSADLWLIINSSYRDLRTYEQSPFAIKFNYPVIKTSYFYENNLGFA